MIEYTLNGLRVACEANPDLPLIRHLRDERRLTGTKEACDGKGHCGACTVLIDGQAALACLQKMSDVAGHEVVTIEGLADRETGQLHPIQQAFIDADAVQCGFCTPGIILASKALLDETPEPTDEQIRHALRRSLCRCTGYSAILEAVRSAARLIPEGTETSLLHDHEGGAIGVSIARPDAVGKVSGTALYSADLHMEGMLHGGALWSAHPYAEVLAIHTEAAEAMPGVHAVLTAKDVAGTNRFGAITPDQPVLAEDRVRFVGDPVALVFAEKPEDVERALEKITVDYRPLEGVFSPADALRPDAPRLHDNGNVLTHLEVATGDVDAAIAAADVTVRGHYVTPFVDQGFLETEAGMAVVDEEGGLTIWTGVQNPFDIRRQVAAAVGLPEEKVRMINMAVGGAFGGKCDVSLQIFLALGALKTRRPVKMVFSRKDSLRFHPKRHAFEMEYRLSATKAGKLLSLEADVVGDTGAYASWGQIVLQALACFVSGPYFVPNSHISLKAVYTNNPPAGAWRGFGIPQVQYALETEMDKLARALGLSPFELRAINAVDKNGMTYMGQVLRESVGLKQTLVEAEEALKRLAPKDRPPTRKSKIGVGVACGFKAVGLPLSMADSAGAIIEVDASGRVLVHVAIVDLGQGPTTAMAQIAAEALGVPLDRVEVQQIDTGFDLPAGATVSQRGIYLGGNATLGATRKLRQRLITVAAQLLEREEANIDFRGGRFVDMRAEEELIDLDGLAALSHARGLSLCEEYQFTETVDDEPAFPVMFNRAKESPKDYYYVTYSYSTQVAVVEVEEATGRVRVGNILAAQDVGKAINPRIIEGQIAGGALMGMGTALTESYQVKNGWNLTDTLAKCGLTDIRRAPDIATYLVEDNEPAGPFGAKGVSEMAAVPTAPAITNAIFDAVGVRVYELPATPSSLRDAIRSAR